MHAPARDWLNDALSGTEEVGLTAPALFGFVRLGTSARVHERPLSVTEASGYVHEWLDRPQVRFLAPGPEHVRLTLSLLERLGTGANLTTDAQVAAYARAVSRRDGSSRATRSHWTIIGVRMIA